MALKKPSEIEKGSDFAKAIEELDSWSNITKILGDRIEFVTKVMGKFSPAVKQLGDQFIYSTGKTEKAKETIKTKQRESGEALTELDNGTLDLSNKSTRDSLIRNSAISSYGGTTKAAHMSATQMMARSFMWGNGSIGRGLAGSIGGAMAMARGGDDKDIQFGIERGQTIASFVGRTFSAVTSMSGREAQAGARMGITARTGIGTDNISNSIGRYAQTYGWDYQTTLGMMGSLSQMGRGAMNSMDIMGKFGIGSGVGQQTMAGMYGTVRAGGQTGPQAQGAFADILAEAVSKGIHKEDLAYFMEEQLKVMQKWAQSGVTPLSTMRIGGQAYDEKGFVSTPGRAAGFADFMNSQTVGPATNLAYVGISNMIDKVGVGKGMGGTTKKSVIDAINEMGPSFYKGSPALDAYNVGYGDLRQQLDKVLDAGGGYGAAQQSIYDSMPKGVKDTPMAYQLMRGTNFAFNKIPGGSEGTGYVGRWMKLASSGKLGAAGDVDAGYRTIDRNAAIMSESDEASRLYGVAEQGWLANSKVSQTTLDLFNTVVKPWREQMMTGADPLGNDDIMSSVVGGGKDPAKLKQTRAIRNLNPTAMEFTDTVKAMFGDEVQPGDSFIDDAGKLQYTAKFSSMGAGAEAGRELLAKSDTIFNWRKGDQTGKSALAGLTRDDYANLPIEQQKAIIQKIAGGEDKQFKDFDVFGSDVSSSSRGGYYPDQQMSKEGPVSLDEWKFMNKPAKPEDPILVVLKQIRDNTRGLSTLKYGYGGS